MAMGTNVLYVGSSAIPAYAYEGKFAGFIYALPLDSATGKPTGIRIVASGLEEPHGVVYRNGDLFYSTTGGLYRVRNADETYADAKPELVLKFPADDTLVPLPGEGHYRIWHQKHPLAFNPVDASDDGLYTAIGIPCNICMVPGDPRYGTILHYDLGAETSTILAKGVRNSVGFDWSKKNGDIWFSDHNRQGFPNPDEINRISASEHDGHYGVPYVFGKDTRGFTQEEYDNPDSTNKPDGLLEGTILSDKPLSEIKPEDYVAPEFSLATNSAPIGVKFWGGYPALPDTEQLLFTTHGRGTAEQPGLEVRMLTIKDGQRVLHEIPLITGWLQRHDPSADPSCLGDGCLGNPTDFLVVADGSLLLSDDVAGVIYRVSYDASGVKDTVISLKVPESPPKSANMIAMVSGTITDPAGNKRMFHMAWGAPNLDIKGLEHGEYSIRLNDVGDWIPSPRTLKATLSESSKTSLVDMKYIPRPEHIEIGVTIHAPPKPHAAPEDKWTVKVKDLKADSIREEQIDWGGSAAVRLPYGGHQVIYPYYPTLIPKPSLARVDVDEESEDSELRMDYRSVGSVGQTVLSETCISCHGPSYFDAQDKAYQWNDAGRPALASTVMGMPIIEGHCDRVCADEVANYLFDNVWQGYLNPGTPYGTRQLRQLTRAEYANSIHDIFGVDVNPGKLPADKAEKTFKYPGQARLGILQPEDVRRYYTVALEVAGAADPNALGYGKGRAAEDQFIRDLGYRMYRRELTPAEHSRYQTQIGEHGQGSVVASMLLSPHFLYRSDLGSDPYGRTTEFKLSPGELATALSFTFLGTTPSVELLQKAERGELDTPDQVAAEVAAMIRTDRGARQFERFVRYYTRTVGKLSEKPNLPPNVADDMEEEQAQFVKHVLQSDNGTFNELFNPGYTFLNEALAEHYAINGVSGSQFQKVDVDDRRGGLLHQGLVQASVSTQTQTSLVQRGFMIREQLFCKQFGSAVENPPDQPDYPERPVTTRERWDLINGEEASGGACWKCHQYVNDTGSTLEHYDAAGRYRLQELAANEPYHGQGAMVDINAAGPIVNNAGAGKWADVDDVRGVSRLIPSNAIALTCMADSYYRYAFGVEPDTVSAGTIKEISDGLKESGNLQEMLQNLAKSYSFTYKAERESK